MTAKGYAQGFRQDLQNMSPVAKILLVCLIVFLFMFISSILSAILAIPIFGCSFADILDSISNPDHENLSLVKYFQIIQSIFVFIIPAIAAAWLFSSNTFRYLGTRGKLPLMTIVLVMCSILVAIPVLNLLTIWNARLDLPYWLQSVERKIIALEESANQLTQLFLDGHNYKDLVVNLIMIAILPAIGEEFLFRGVFQRLFTEWTRNQHWGVILGAFIFSFFHFQFYGFVPRFLLGVYFGYLLVWSGTIWLPVVAHFINNGLAVIYYHFSSGQLGETMLDQIGTETENYYMLLISAVFTVLLIYATYRYVKVRNESGR